MGIEIRDVDRYCDIESFCKDIVYSFDIGYGDRFFEGIDIVASGDVVLGILNYLVKNTDYKLYSIDIEAEIWSEYSDSYVLSISYDGLILCEKALREDGYVDIGGPNTMVFVHKDTSEGFIKTNADVDMIFFDVSDECNCADKCNTDVQKPCKDECGRKLEYNMTLGGNLDMDEIKKWEQTAEHFIRWSEKVNKMIRNMYWW